MQTSRRTACRAALGLAAVVLLPLRPQAHPTWRPNLPRWRRNRSPHLARRRVLVRWVRGRPVWVVPVGIAAGWELVHDDRLMQVRETRVVMHDGERRELATVVDAGGRLSEVEILREDTPDKALEPALESRS
ncbi:MAG: hypothetical protein AB7U92_06230 [Piscinibacter sp.]|uniref:hypothetical protein n=1 Tax=Piscinibacter sp. TaxID=1903157 RepID=UPI003D0ED27D